MDEYVYNNLYTIQVFSNVRPVVAHVEISRDIVIFPGSAAFHFVCVASPQALFEITPYKLSKSVSSLEVTFLCRTDVEWPIVPR